MVPQEPDSDGRTWTFLTNHAHVLLALSRDPDLRQRDIAELVGITQGAAQRIIQELEDGGYVRCERVGRLNRYHIAGDVPLRHPLEDGHSVAELLAALEA